MADIDEYVTVADAAKIIGCTVGRVRQLIYAGKLTARKISANAWLVLRSTAAKVADNPSHTGRPRTAPKKSSRTT